jgi:glycosyltransferase involved in cell wall biosynthesis
MGTRGIPNNYGGFEQVATCLSQKLVQRGHTVSVYNPHNHTCKAGYWNGVTIVHCYDPETSLGTAGQFVYDLNCILHARKQNYDMILMLGYTSSSVWGWLYPRNIPVITNMDGWEWKRSKYGQLVRKFLLYAERLAVKYSTQLVADSPVIKSYLDEKYHTETIHITYGACEQTEEEMKVLEENGLAKNGYFMLMARMEPENNIEMILDGICAAGLSYRVWVVGNTDTAFARKLVAKFRNNERIRFAGGSFHQVAVHTLRKCCRIYFHGHSVGGTNPSLLEAMASGALICAHDNPFNRVILGEDALYFRSAEDVGRVCLMDTDSDTMVLNNKQKIAGCYNWDTVTDAYEQLFLQQVQGSRFLIT